MQSIARQGDLITLTWLHDAYPGVEVDCMTLRALGCNSEGLNVIMWLLRHYPEVYKGLQVFWVGLLCGHLEIVQARALSCRHLRNPKQIIGPMKVAARHGHLHMVQ